MIEAGAHQVPENVIMQGFKQAVEENKKIITLINELAAEVGQTKLVVENSAVDQQVFFGI